MKALFAATLLLASSCTTATPPPSAAAEAEATLTLKTMRLHDPFVVADRASRTYYLFTSNIAKACGYPRE